mmetsp:Transcript_14539/g.41420  ORF Transcript_14539/g.41420 Transcript_14539/m.41420 type:complete len:255 (-) Transcript_14539:657-1421(-)
MPWTHAERKQNFFNLQNHRAAAALHHTLRAFWSPPSTSILCKQTHTHHPRRRRRKLGLRPLPPHEPRRPNHIPLAVARHARRLGLVLEEAVRRELVEAPRVGLAPRVDLVEEAVVAEEARARYARRGPRRLVVAVDEHQFRVAAVCSEQIPRMVRVDEVVARAVNQQQGRTAVAQRADVVHGRDLGQVEARAVAHGRADDGQCSFGGRADGQRRVPARRRGLGHELAAEPLQGSKGRVGHDARDVGVPRRRVED